MLNTHETSPVLIACGLLITIHTAALAAPRFPRFPLLGSPPPAAPATFDQQTLQDYLDKVEEGQNALVLKFFYFMGHRRQAFPPQEGYILLKKAVDEAVVGSRRWFLLQSIRGFGGTHLKGNTDDGLMAYEALFDAATQAQDADATEILLSTVGELASSILGSYEFYTYQARYVGLLRKALTAYVEHVPQTPEGFSHIDWSTVISRTNNEKVFQAIIEPKLQGAQHLPYGLLWLAAGIYEDSSPARSEEFLRSAKQYLPQTKEAVTAKNQRQVTSLYSALVKLLRGEKKYQEAIVEQKELIGLTGWGRDALAALQAQQGDAAGLDESLRDLLALVSDEQEINDTANALWAVSLPDDAMKIATDDKAALLLANYLQLPRERETLQDLRARFNLGTYWSKKKKIAEAIAILKVDVKPRDDPRSMTNRYIEMIQKLRESLEAKG